MQVVAGVNGLGHFPMSVSKSPLSTQTPHVVETEPFAGGLVTVTVQVTRPFCSGEMLTLVPSVVLSHFVIRPEALSPSKQSLHSRLETETVTGQPLVLT